MIILSIDTSCDETSVAVTEGRRVLSNVIYSQVVIHKQWGGVVPSLAKRAHQERIDFVVKEALANAKMSMDEIDAIAVTQGPGLAVALEVGILKAKELAKQFSKKLVAVNHMEGHLYSSFVQNSKGNPKREFVFPMLGFLVSGAHTEIILWKDHLTYEVLGETLDDAAGEALDKGARLLLNIGYPGGGVIERLSAEVKNEDRYKFPRPMQKIDSLDYSFSGLKTALFYKVQKMTENEKLQNVKYLTSSFQEAVFDTLLMKLKKAIMQTGCSRIACGGGVIANHYLRKRLRSCLYDLRGRTGRMLFPPFKYLTGDNAAMIGVVAGFKAEKNMFVENINDLDRIPRLRLS
ncbi:MAG: tRNA (adenosine(37)-N6)-threonylcarbamoyltransferase complex transferase subunit TsaD [Microgenomates group bacterium]|jgi:N6-L-threonylcarbamoyladenine synthase|nr:MAG: tRNA (adenosine(37)-N6)-threonylcarbamoyltransferase complex transferase subunit TsaD [Candidatus Roizmanbacteria bacterium]